VGIGERGQDRVLVWKVLVERTDRDVRGLGNAIGGAAAVAELGENASSGIEDALSGLGGPLLFRLLAGAESVRWGHGHLRGESE